MSRTNGHKRVFQNLLSRYFPSVWYQLCPTGEFPRVEYEFRQLNVENIPYEKYILTLNCFDKGQSETIDDCIDELIENSGRAIYLTDAAYYQFYYCNDRQPVPEADKAVKRIMLTFEVRIYLRSEA